jgi:hypothetical protein
MGGEQQALGDCGSVGGKQEGCECVPVNGAIKLGKSKLGSNIEDRLRVQKPVSKVRSVAVGADSRVEARSPGWMKAQTVLASQMHGIDLELQEVRVDQLLADKYRHRHLLPLPALQKYRRSIWRGQSCRVRDSHGTAQDAYEPSEQHGIGH